MIITVSREPDAHTWTVTPTNDDGSKIVRDTGDNHHNDVPWRPTGHAHGTLWDRVGELISRESRDNPGAPVQVVYRDGNSLTARTARAHAKTFALDLPHRVWVWIAWRNVRNATLTRAQVEAETVHLGQETAHRMTFAAVPGMRAALDRLVELVDDVRMTRGQDPADFAACQSAVERLDALYRDLRTPWCDTCKQPAIRQEHPARWAHATEERPLGVPESLDTTGHEVTASEWNQT
jgi:hypothetical protein